MIISQTTLGCLENRYLFWLFGQLSCDQVVQVRPRDKDAKVKLGECKKAVQILSFQRAIAVDDDTKCIADSINLDAMSEYSNLNLKWLYQAAVRTAAIPK